MFKHVVTNRLALFQIDNECHMAAKSTIVPGGKK